MSNKMIKWGSSNDKEYFVDVNAFMETRDKARKKEFQHSCHEHLLELREVFLDSTNDVICDGCGLFIRGCAYYTSSTPDCVFNLHEFCAHLPQNMTHLILDEDNCQHIHKLTPKSTNEKGNPDGFNCNICGQLVFRSVHCVDKKNTNKIYYKCCEDGCKFVVDFRCVASVLAVKDSTHRHALTPHLYPASFLCSICGEKNDDEESLSYICHECPFWVHDSCYPLPRTIQQATHPHPMRITFDYDLKMKCGICKETSKKQNYWWYGCPSCSYTIHVKCSFRERNTNVLSKLDQEALKSRNDLLLPNKTSMHQTLTQLVRKLCKTGEEKEEESSSVDKLLLNNEDNNHVVCDACVLRVCEPPLNADNSCKFFLHKWCANLPKELKITHHKNPEHTFAIVEKKTHEFDFHRCRMCEKVGNGFFFKCTVCEDYYIDIKCASLPNSIEHYTDEHPLLLLRTSVLRTSEHLTNLGTCYCCVNKLQYSEYVYGCLCCHVFLHVSCVWIPQKMKYWYDEHPFSLVYNWPVPISGDGSDDYFCEFCEITIRDDYWFYHCSECNQSSHIRCIGRDLYPMLKFGDCYELGNTRKHPLITCVMVPSRDLNQDIVKLCSLCDDGLPDPDRTTGGWDEMLFECLNCKIVLHPYCVDYELHKDDVMVEGMWWKWRKRGR